MKRVNRELLYKKNRSFQCQELVYKKINLSNGISDSNGFNEISSKSLLNFDLALHKPKDENEKSKKNHNLNMILNELKLITKKLKSDEEDEQKSLDWKFAAMVIDRLCLVFFSLATFFSTAVILLTAKNFFKFR